MPNYRKAQVINGALVAVGSALTGFFDLRFVWLVLFMGASLIYSGIADFCGFAAIFDRIHPEDERPDRIM